MAQATTSIQDLPKANTLDNTLSLYFLGSTVTTDGINTRWNTANLNYSLLLNKLREDVPNANSVISISSSLSVITLGDGIHEALSTQWNEATDYVNNNKDKIDKALSGFAAGNSITGYVTDYVASQIDSATNPIETSVVANYNGINTLCNLLTVDNDGISAKINNISTNVTTLSNTVGPLTPSVIESLTSVADMQGNINTLSGFVTNISSDLYKYNDNTAEYPPGNKYSIIATILDLSTFTQDGLVSEQDTLSDYISVVNDDIVVDIINNNQDVKDAISSNVDNAIQNNSTIQSGIKNIITADINTTNSSSRAVISSYILSLINSNTTIKNAIKAAVNDA